MNIGDRLRELREARHLSQGDIEERTGLLRCYISRVECGHTIPAVETLEKMARALDIRLYQLMYDGDKPPSEADVVTVSRRRNERTKESHYFRRLTRQLARMTDDDRDLIMAMAAQVAKK
jgi:transcriptional regulator with XRE-family HTH domain